MNFEETYSTFIEIKTEEVCVDLSELDQVLSVDYLDEIQKLRQKRRRRRRHVRKKNEPEPEPEPEVEEESEEEDEIESFTICSKKTALWLLIVGLLGLFCYLLYQQAKTEEG